MELSQIYYNNALAPGTSADGGDRGQFITASIWPERI